MSMPEAGKAWGQLVSITDLDSAPILLNKEKLTIGRAKACDLSFGENKLVSGRHCHLERDGEGRVWLCDTSTNGTLWNLEEKVKGQRKELKHGDEFYVVYKKNNEDLNVGYMYQDLSELEREENDDTLDYSDVLEATLVDTDANEVDFESRKRNQVERSDSPAPSVKRRRTEESADEKTETRPGLGGSQAGCQHSDQETTDDVTGTGTGGNVTSADVTNDNVPPAKELDTIETKEVPQTEKPAETKDGIEETLLCIICQEIFHDCISLQPCLHSFCAGCYSDWMKRSNECPSCRMKVDRINRNHMVNNLVEAYLREHPDKKRPEEDIKELEAKNKITRDMLYPKRRRRHYSGSDNSDDEEDEYTDESNESYDEAPHFNPAPAPVGGVLFGLGTPLFGTMRPPPVLCRQCPGYVDTAPSTGDKTPSEDSTSRTSGENTEVSAAGSSTTVATDQPSTSGEQSSSNQNTDDIKTMPTPPPYHCRANQNHVLCACCFQPMPDRRAENKNNPAVPPMSCTMCYRNYCHAYWGCRKADCLGCFCKFGDMNFGKKCLTNLILDNPHESQILADYLKSKSISVKAMLKSCLTKMERGEYVCQDRGRFNLSSQIWLCYACALRNFKELAYYYRRDIPHDQLPAEVTARPDCYWGKNCRTQRGKAHHAQRFNHICDQSRTA